VKTGKIAVRVATLDKRLDPVSVLCEITSRRGAFALESIGNVTGRGGYSIFGAEPVREVAAESFDAWADAIGELERIECPDDVPFAGGGVGVLDYEGGAALERVLPRSTGPTCRFGLYDTTIICDHARDRWLVAAADLPDSAETADERLAAWVERFQSLPDCPAVLRKPVATTTRPVADMSAADYEAKVARAIEYIAAGDIYQVNLAQRWTAQTSAADLALYLALREENPADFLAFLPGADRSVLTCSPELFLELACDGRVTTRPIKGTRPRGASAAEDRRLGQELLSSEKDRAELAMIVDLLRNDLGRVAELGSVRVLEEAAVEVHPTVLHLVATIEARVRPEVGAIELLRATFPGGSITGCPKIRAMQIIRELEPSERGPYCGAIGFIGLDGRMRMNVAIRTMVKTGDTLHIHAGGAITADSDPVSEYHECLAKAEGMFRALGAAPVPAGCNPDPRAATRRLSSVSSA
jgi:para-aminobenzoate synthetase component 1